MPQEQAENPAATKSQGVSDGGTSPTSGCPDYRNETYPPKLTKAQVAWLWLLYPILALSILFLLGEFWIGPVIPHGPFVTYLAFGLLLTVALVDRYWRHKLHTHEARREDISEVDATIVEACTIEPRLTEPEERPVQHERKVAQLNSEVKRRELIGNRAWTEYQVLSLNQMLVDFLKEDELKARARAALSELEEYATDTAYRYDLRQHAKWEGSVEEAVEKIGDEPDRLKRDENAEALRAELRTLLEHVASYKKDWAEGSAMIRALTEYGAVSIPVLLIMGILPVLRPMPDADASLGILNWGLLGMAGSLMAVCLQLRRSDLVEVGNTEGKKELWRTVVGAVLGLVAGVLAHCMLAGGLLTGGSIVPDPRSSEWTDIGLTVVWAVASGVCFEALFDRVRQSTFGA